MNLFKILFIIWILFMGWVFLSGCSYRIYNLDMYMHGTRHSATVQVNPDVEKSFELSPTVDIAP